MARFTMVLGDIEAQDLGHCQPHEHLWVDAGPASQINPQLCMDKPDESLAELISYSQHGGSTLVDAQPLGAGRNIEKLAWLSRKSGINVIAATGFHLPFFYPENHWIHTATVEKLTELFSSELNEGAFLDGSQSWPEQRTSARAGLVKAAMGKNGLDAWTERLLTAAGQAAVIAGSSLMLHTELGFEAVEAIHLLGSLGLPPQRILVCHIDRQTENLAPHFNVAKTGAFLEYDTIGRFKYHDDASEIWLIRQMIAAGHLNQILLSLDTTAERFKSYGGPIGLDYIFGEFLPALQASGISRQACIQMTRQNPALALARIN